MQTVMLSPSSNVMPQSNGVMETTLSSQLTHPLLNPNGVPFTVTTIDETSTPAPESASPIKNVGLSVIIVSPGGGEMDVTTGGE